MQKHEFLKLIDKYLAGQATAAEKKQLSVFFESFQGDAEWDEKVLGVKQKLEDKMLANIRQAIVQPEPIAQPKIVNLHRFRNVAAAVAALAVMGTAVYHWIGKHQYPAQLAQNKAVVKHDVDPGDNRAVLTLANGQKVILDSAKIGLLNQSGDISINKTDDGQVVYTDADKDHAPAGALAYNTISTPRGGQFHVVLPDGTTVFLNAASSLKFPTTFSGNQRDVELTGEGYFEVAHNKAKPFTVQVKDAQVRVLGTHFNVSAYSDDKGIKATLLEGAVKLIRGDVSNTLKPGQQGIINDNGIKVIDVDTDEELAWKNGLFNFNRSNIQDIMKELSRWYDTEVVYEGKIPDDEFVGKIRRDVKLSQVLHILELSHVRFRIENKKIIVAP
ncbi:FecR family protein [Mucilaginibacter celer]|uniref:DUF4974 domain-containing protein n=1 Tax=Mucilaginibacter celer TaxID=2305508 RepID=A0A494VS24_9SPHI|nr:FecR family protein [Mucilaginibacter celer]AYL94175.1 DUF4974 domain-containing protein [Mucilaginibacter celer]